MAARQPIDALGEFEQAVLLAIAHLGPEAYLTLILNGGTFTPTPVPSRQ